MKNIKDKNLLANNYRSNQHKNQTIICHSTSLDPIKEWRFTFPRSGKQINE